MKNYYHLLRVLCIAMAIPLLSVYYNTSSAQIISTFPYTEDFGNTSCGLPAGYSNVGSDPWDFQNTNETYMDGLDHTSGSGCFASMDDSGTAIDDTCLLTSPTFDLTALSTAQLRFWWQNSNSTSSIPHTAGPRPWSNLYVDVSTNNGTTWTRNVWMVEDSQQIGWAEGIVNLTPYISTTTVVRFRGLETQSFYSDMSLDDILIYEPQQWDAEISALISPVSGGCGDAAAIVEVSIKNNGYDTITSMPISYQLGSSNSVNEVLSATILPASTYNYSFSTPVNLSASGKVGLTVWSNLIGDAILNNDTVADSVVIAPTISTYPYVQDFEAGEAGWVIDPLGVNSTWAFGTPTKTIINSASSGVNAFVNGGLSGTYNTSENSQVNSPCFDLSATTGEVWVAMDVWYDMETNYDGAVLQYTINDGMTWETIGESGDPYNWYNNPSIVGTPGGQDEGWSGTGTISTGGYIQVKHALPESVARNKKLILRVAFGSDGSVVDNGIAFDNFAVVDFKQADLGEVSSLCGEASRILDPKLNFNGIIEWSTGDTISQTITVTDTGKYVVTYTDTILNLTTIDSTAVIITDPPQINFAATIDTINIDGQTTIDPQTSFELEYLWTPGGYNFPYLLVKGSEVGLGTHQYNLLVTDSVDCTDEQIATVEVIEVDFTGIDENKTVSMNVYPNPVKDILSIVVKGFEGKMVTMEVYDLQGRTVATRTFNQSVNQLYSLDLSKLTAGMYMLNVRGDNKTVQSQIIVQ